MATIIRMGAAHWDATIPTKDGALYFDFSSMTKDERKKFHTEFMAAYRQTRKRKKRTS